MSENSEIDHSQRYSEIVAFLQAGRLDEAQSDCAELVRNCPEYADAHHILGVLAGQRDNYVEAIAHFRRATELDDARYGYFMNLALACRKAGAHGDAIEALKACLSLNPNLPEAHYESAVVLDRLGDAEAVLEHCGHAIALRADYADAWDLRASTLRSLGRIEEARVACEEVIRIQPDLPGAWYNYSLLLCSLGQFDEAEQTYRRVLQLNPDDSVTHSTLLFHLAAYLRLPPDMMLEEQRDWNLRHGARGREIAGRRTFRQRQDGQLRIGYVSPDFREHAVSHFFEPLLEAHNRDRVLVNCYNIGKRAADATTTRLRNLADGWTDADSLTDEELAERIHADRIDVLVDLAGHTADNRLKVFTMRPAPVQVTYLGYFAGTGLQAMDYWLSDEILHPIDSIEQSVESVMRLPRVSHCYRPPDTPDVAPPPDNGSKPVFGSFSNVVKLTRDCVRIWSRVLAKVPGSRLLLNTAAMADSGTRDRLATWFAEHGIGSERLQMVANPDHDGWFRCYQNVDIMLDPIPRTGCTTAAETLWMGVPLVTLAGGRFVERAGAMVLQAIGHSELVAASESEYVQIAAALASDPQRRAGLRSQLRDDMKSSPLMDSRGLAEAIETAFADMLKQRLS